MALPFTLPSKTLLPSIQHQTPLTAAFDPLPRRDKTKQQWSQLVMQETEDGTIERSLLFKMHGVEVRSRGRSLARLTPTMQASEYLALLIGLMAKQCTVKGFAPMRSEIKLSHLNFYQVD